MAINYAQCWEDTAVLRRALQINSDDEVVSIASGGDNSLALLLDNPRSITAIDFNIEQVYLVELKIAALGTLDYDDFVAFLGASPCDNRRSIYHAVRTRLSPQAKAYWNSHTGVIRDGVIHSGKFERYLAAFRRYLLPLIVDRKSIAALVSAESTQEQRAVFTGHFVSRRWRLLFRLMFNRQLLSWFGRYPGAFSQVDRGDIAAELLRRTEYGLTEIPVKDNYIVRYALTGNYDLKTCAPAYLLPSNFHILRERVNRLRLVHGGLQTYLERIPAGTYAAFNLSDILEYLTDKQAEDLLHAVDRSARPGARLAFWTMFRDQSIPGTFAGRFMSDGGGAHQLPKQDRGFFYGGFDVWRKSAGVLCDRSADTHTTDVTGAL